jgi:hypothetical protein
MKTKTKIIIGSVVVAIGLVLFAPIPGVEEPNFDGMSSAEAQKALDFYEFQWRWRVRLIVCRKLLGLPPNIGPATKAPHHQSLQDVAPLKTDSLGRVVPRSTTEIKDHEALLRAATERGNQ